MDLAVRLVIWGESVQNMLVYMVDLAMELEILMGRQYWSLLIVWVWSYAEDFL